MSAAAELELQQAVTTAELESLRVSVAAEREVAAAELVKAEQQHAEALAALTAAQEQHAETATEMRRSCRCEAAASGADGLHGG